MISKNIKQEFFLANQFSNFVIFKTQTDKINIDVFSGTILYGIRKKNIRTFEKDRSVVTKYLKNIFADRELDENSVCAKFAHTTQDGKILKSDVTVVPKIIWK